MATAYLSGSVYRGESPILLVVHYEDGDWAFLDGGIADEKDAAVVHLRHVFDDRGEVQSLWSSPGFVDT